MTSPFDSIQLRSTTLTNRIAMAPLKTAYGTTAGQVTDRLIAFFRRRAEGGVALIISEPLYVTKKGQEHPRQLGIDDDDKLPGLRRLVDAVHLSGTKIFAHLNHAGRAANTETAGRPLEAPSPVACPRSGVAPQALNEPRIVEIVGEFRSAARRAREAGFDGVELQFGLGYLVAQFMSRRTNLRHDRYGGDAESRQRFAREVYLAARDAVGDDLPIGIRISASEKVPGGLEIEDARRLCRMLEPLGVDLVHVVTGSSCDSAPWTFQHMALPPWVNEGLAARIRDGVTVPVMASGRLGDPARLREVFDLTMADLVALGRPLLADPDLPTKLEEGRDEDILLCGHCLQGCLASVCAGQGIGCNFNPEVGRELETMTRTDHPKHVVVIGGGPAGMQAALTAHDRGHRVTLLEKRRLGGQFELAHVPPDKKRLAYPLGSLVERTERSGVDIRLGDEATRSQVDALDADVVVVATGSRPAKPTMRGLEDALTGEEILSGNRQPGPRVLVLGGSMLGTEVAELLARGGRQVVIIETLDEIGGDMDPVSRGLMFKRLAALHVEIHRATRLLRLANQRAFVDCHGDRRDLGEFDSVVTATAVVPFDPLSHELEKAGFDVKVIGDAAEPGQVRDAIRSGHDLAMVV